MTYNWFLIRAKVETWKTNTLPRWSMKKLYKPAPQVETLLEAAGLPESPGYLRTIYKTRRLTKLLR